MAGNAAGLGQRSTSIATAQQLHNTSVATAGQQHNSSFTAPCENTKRISDKQYSMINAIFFIIGTIGSISFRKLTTRGRMS